jgi:hypothetical protein
MVKVILHDWPGSRIGAAGSHAGTLEAASWWTGVVLACFLAALRYRLWYPMDATPTGCAEVAAGAGISDANQ